LEVFRSRRFAEESPQRPLFHYTSGDVALDHLLTDGRLRLQAPTGLNDPFESEPISVAFLLEDQNQQHRRGTFEAASELLRNTCRLCCLTLSGHYDHGPVGFGDGFARARMWAQYAENHAGVCLAFNQDRLRAAAIAAAKARDLRLYEAGVKYRVEGGLDRAISLPYARVAQDLPGLIEDVFPVHVARLYFSKAWDWSTETEYRFLLHGKVNDYEYIDVRHALTGVFCGPAFPDGRIKDICARCPELTDAGRVYKLSWRNGVATTTPMSGGSVAPMPEWDIPPAPSDPA